MSDPEQQTPEDKPEPPETGPEAPRDTKALRRKTVAFIVIFIVSAFVLLVGYDRAKDTRFNDWYLLRVAQSTEWLLNRVGFSCTVSDSEAYTGREAEVRAKLEAWKRGEDSPSAVSPSKEPAPPLTSWEAWQYQAGRHREAIALSKRELARLREAKALSPEQRDQKVALEEKALLELQMKDIGPRVIFVLKPGVLQRLSRAKEHLAKLKETSPANDPAIAQTEAEIAEFQKQFGEAQKDPDKNRREVTGYTFAFILIPTCSAVQEMVIFLSAILAFPARWWKRFVGLLIGLPALYWVNAFRLAVLACIGAVDASMKWFTFAHEYLWQGIYIVFVVALWMGWVELLVRRRDG